MFNLVTILSLIIPDWSIDLEAGNGLAGVVGPDGEEPGPRVVQGGTIVDLIKENLVALSVPARLVRYTQDVLSIFADPGVLVESGSGF